MSAQNEFRKAIKYLDFGKDEKGEQCLRDAINLAKSEGDKGTLIEASCCYGDYLCSIGKTNEAKPYLELVLSLESASEPFQYEFKRAQELLTGC